MPAFLLPLPLRSSGLPRPKCGSHRHRPQASLSPTPLVPLTFRNQRVLIKRDDTLRVEGLWGSKARKFRSLTRPGAMDGVRAIASFGGTQSNAMASLARFAQCRNVRFYYFVARDAPSHVRKLGAGNYADAVRAGMRVRVVEKKVFERVFMRLETGEQGEEGIAEEAEEWVRRELKGDVLFVPQGGAWAGAEDGVRELANEILSQVQGMRQRGELLFPKKLPVIFLGAGTGSTAFFLSRSLQGACRVVAVPVAGSPDYLVRQMRLLELNGRGGKVVGDDLWNEGGSATVEVLRPRVRGNFADVREGKLLVWIELQRAAKEAGIEGMQFDLIYAARAWEEVFLAIEQSRMDVERDVLFLCTGGQEGNRSMLDRFCYKGLITREFADEALISV